MFAQPVIDTLIIIGMFILRIGVPLAIVLVIGAWLEKRLAPAAAEQSERRTEGARIILFRPRQSVATPPQPASKDDPAKRITKAG